MKKFALTFLFFCVFSNTAFSQDFAALQSKARNAANEMFVSMLSDVQDEIRDVGALGPGVVIGPFDCPLMIAAIRDIANGELQGDAAEKAVAAAIAGDRGNFVSDSIKAGHVLTPTVAQRAVMITGKLDLEGAELANALNVGIEVAKADIR